MARRARRGDVVVTMGAPPISLMGDELLAALHDRATIRPPAAASTGAPPDTDDGSTGRSGAADRGTGGGGASGTGAAEPGPAAPAAVDGATSAGTSA